jgi:hypothetical protein
VKSLIRKLSRQLGTRLDEDRYLHVGNAFGKRSIFVYRPRDRMPFLVVRMPHNPEGIERCRIEQASQVFLARERIPGIQSTKSLGVVEYAGQQCYIQQAMHTRSLMLELPILTKRAPVRCFRDITQCLVAVYQHTKGEVPEEGKSYFQCYKHGDFWIGNLGRAGKEIAMYDLEFSDIHGQPLYDLLHFGLYYEVVMQNIGKVSRRVVLGDQSGVNDVRTFMPTTDTVSSVLLDSDLGLLMRSCIRTYLDQCNIGVNDGCELIKKYIETDRGITGLPNGWELDILP